MRLKTTAEIQKKYPHGCREPELLCSFWSASGCNCRILHQTLRMETTIRLAAFHMQRVSLNTIISSRPGVRAAFIAPFNIVHRWERRLFSITAKGTNQERNAPLIRHLIAKLIPEPDTYPHPYPQGVFVERPDIFEVIDGLEGNRGHCRHLTTSTWWFSGRRPGCTGKGSSNAARAQHRCGGPEIGRREGAGPGG